MSTNTKIAVGVIVVVVLAGGAWWWAGMNQPTQNQAIINPPAQTQTAPTNTNPNPAPANNGQIAATDNSNASLQASLANVDSQMNGFSSDNASVAQGMNDQPVQQQQF